MDTKAKIVWIVVLFILAVLVLGLKDHWIWIRCRRRYSRMQSERATLSDEDFCRRVGMDTSFFTLVSTIRTTLASHGDYDPLRIYPEDNFYPHFKLNYDDDVAMVVREMKIIRNYQDYSFPLEEVTSVADFVKVILRLRKMAGQPDNEDAG